MRDIKKTIIEEMESRYVLCLGGRDSPEQISMQEAADQIGEQAFMEALLKGSSIKRCRNCGRLFVAKNSRECYCDRLVAEGRTCKDVGAGHTRNSDPVNNVMDKARRLHLYRQSAAGRTEEARSKYRAWEKFALKCESRCRNGEISVEELKELVGRNYTKDAGRRAGSAR